MPRLQTTFEKIRELAERFAQELGKEVVFISEGGEIGIPAKLTEKIEVSLIHLLKNALDHGIEPPAERIQNGKPRVGTLALSGYFQGKNLVLEFQDDGKGIDGRKVVARATTLELLPMGKSPQEKDVLDLIFTSGFSSRAQANEFSGRGIGLDVVKTTLEELAGNIEVDSAPGTGVKFCIRIPHNGLVEVAKIRRSPRKSGRRSSRAA